MNLYSIMGGWVKNSPGETIMQFIKGKLSDRDKNGFIFACLYHLIGGMALGYTIARFI